MDHLGELRYCPRCDQETVWTNVADGGTVFCCTVAFHEDPDGERRTVAGCGLDGGELVTDEEYARLRAKEPPVYQPVRYEYI